jgi:hypothetical protein
VTLSGVVKREAPAQAEVRPTCAGLPALTWLLSGSRWIHFGLFSWVDLLLCAFGKNACNLKMRISFVRRNLDGCENFLWERALGAVTQQTAFSICKTF